MRASPNPLVELYRLTPSVDDAGLPYGNNGCFLLPAACAGGVGRLRCVVSDTGGWDHVSVSPETGKRTPTWPEMKHVKELLWLDDEAVFELHPAKRDYVNCHPYVLHLWRPQGVSMPMPPAHFVGPAAEIPCDAAGRASLFVDADRASADFLGAVAASCGISVDKALCLILPAILINDLKAPDGVERFSRRLKQLAGDASAAQA